MKALVYHNYGNPSVVKLTEIAKPVHKNDELLVKVVASSINRTDCGFRSAEYFVSRFWSGLFKPKFPVLGCEFSGIVEDIGSSVSQFKIGDKVFGYNDKTFGGHAEYLTINENDAVAVLPTNITFEQGAALTEGAHYALSNIRASKIKEGEYAMVYGATGAIGSAAVQIMKSLGIHVTAVCPTHSVNLIKNLGADVVVDYQTTDFTLTTQKFNFIFDAVGKSSFKQCKPLLSEKGIYISTEFGKNCINLLLALTTPIMGGKKLLFPIPTICKEDINYLSNLAESGGFKPLIDKQYLLKDYMKAYEHVESRQKIGNVILKISE
jgi:NADPH:quinone reductase-like Zn-dependent oxidoreductase